MDLSRLSGALKPAVVVTAADLARDGIRVFPFYAGDLLCPIGKTPLYRSLSETVGRHHVSEGSAAVESKAHSTICRSCRRQMHSVR